MIYEQSSSTARRADWLDAHERKIARRLLRCTGAVSRRYNISDDISAHAIFRFSRRHGVLSRRGTRRRVRPLLPPPISILVESAASKARFDDAAAYLPFPDAATFIEAARRRLIRSCRRSQLVGLTEFLMRNISLFTPRAHAAVSDSGAPRD